MTKETIRHHVTQKLNFKKEVEDKLAILEIDYTRKKIKLLHIIDNLPD